MADKFEREIEEILAKLDGDGPLRTDTPAKRPIPIASAKRASRKKPKEARRSPRGGGNPLAKVTPTTLLFAGAGTMIAGFILSNIYGPLIWASFGGVVLFLAAFLWSFRRSPSASAGAPAAKGHYWRDRYIEYEAAPPSALGRLSRRFRRK